MPSYRKRGGVWRAEIARKGIRKSGTFNTKAEAVAWFPLYDSMKTRSARHLVLAALRRELPEDGKLVSSAWRPRRPSTSPTTDPTCQSQCDIASGAWDKLAFGVTWLWHAWPDGLRSNTLAKD